MLRTDGDPQDGGNRARDRGASSPSAVSPWCTGWARMEIGEASVVVIAAAPHRRPAFDAALEGINRLKRLVPIWKKEFFADGEVWVEGEWDENAPRAAGGLASGPSFSSPALLFAAGRRRPSAWMCGWCAYWPRVKDQAGALVGSLEQRRISTSRDNGAPQEIAVFERQTDQPLSVAILIDNSGSTAKDLKYEIDSVTRFVQARSSAKAIRRMPSRSTASTGRSCSTTASRATSARSNGPCAPLHGEAGTALYDAILLASRDIEDRQGRKILVVVTDGGDTVSHSGFQSRHRSGANGRRRHLSRSWWCPSPTMRAATSAAKMRSPPWPSAPAAASSSPRSAPRWISAFDQILRDLRTQYLLGFYPKNVPLTKDRFHTLAGDACATPICAWSRAVDTMERPCRSAVPLVCRCCQPPAGTVPGDETVRQPP